MKRIPKKSVLHDKRYHLLLQDLKQTEHDLDQTRQRARAGFDRLLYLRGSIFADALPLPLKTNQTNRGFLCKESSGSIRLLKRFV